MSEKIIIPDDGSTTVVGNEVHHHHHHYRNNNNSNLSSKWGIAALSALTGGVLTWAAMAHGGLGTQPAAQPAEITAGTLHDGTFTGAGQGVTGGDVIVTITVANGQITNVEARYPNDWEGNAAAIPQLIDQSKSAQSANIANVTGSTVTSEAFKGSLQDAINQARGGTAAPAPAPAPVTPAAALHDGLFFGRGYISSGGQNPQNTYVTMRVVDGKIVGISATYPLGNETSEQLSADAIPQLVTEAKEKQSADLTNITGATNSSGAFKQSLQDAINQSQAGASTAPAAATLHDGTFVGHPASTGRAGDAVVTITVTGGRISDVTADLPEHSWGDTSNAEIVPVLVAETKEKQSAYLSNVTGATGSTSGFVASLQSAINQAKGDEGGAEAAAAPLHDGVFFGAGYISSGGQNPQNTYVTMRVVDGKIVGVSATYPLGNETSEQLSSNAIPQLVTEAKEKQSADLTNITGATNSSGAFKQSLQDAINQSRAGAAVAAPLGNVSDGVFAGHPASTGRAGDAIVTVTITGGQITDVTAVMPEHSWGDTSNAEIVPVLVAEAKEKQSAHLTNITGATGSTTAFLTSLQSALNIARGQ